MSRSSARASSAAPISASTRRAASSPGPTTWLSGSGGKDHVWPQNLTSYRGAVREFERRIADHVIATGQAVKFKQTFNYGAGLGVPTGATRPIDFTYYVFDKNGNVLFQNNFRNP